MKLAIVGSTGLVGRTMIRVLEERAFPIDELFLFASASSAGMVQQFRGEDIVVRELTDESFKSIDIALFSAGGVLSRAFAPIAVKAGCTVIDNSSAYRMESDVPLVVPEVNPDDAINHHGIIANPNCSTIQLAVALKPLQAAYGISRIIVSTYQSVSGAGHKGISQLQSELSGIEPQHRITPHQLAFNTVFHTRPEPIVGSFTEEEIKIKREMRRIFSLPDLPIAATCVRIPSIGGHAESVYVELSTDFDFNDIHQLLASQPGLIVMDDTDPEHVPNPVMAQGKDEVFIGRIRQDEDNPKGLMMWVVADNLRKGAATNAVQIAELLRK